MDTPKHISVKESKKDTLHMIRMFNTNIDGRLQILKALGTVRGVGDRFAFAVITHAGIDAQKRAGELTEEEQKHLIEVMQAPLKFGIPEWFLNHQRDFTDAQ